MSLQDPDQDPDQDPLDDRIFLMFTCDGEMVKKYIHIVEGLERAYQSSPDYMKVARWSQPTRSPKLEDDNIRCNVYDACLELEKTREHPEIKEVRHQLEWIEMKYFLSRVAIGFAFWTMIIFR
jgi:hypothetical protein